MNPIITEADFRKLTKTAGRAFLLFGEEDYLKSYAVKSTRERICADPAFAIFNDVTIDALDYTPDKLLDAMMPPPMMADERLIVIRGLELIGGKVDELLEPLIETLALLPEYDYNTVLIHVASGCIDEGRPPKKPGTVLKKLSEVTTPVHFTAPTDARLTAWVGKHFSHFGVAVSPNDCGFLVAYAGKNMYLLASEIEKVAHYVRANGRSEANAEDIRLVAVRAMGTDAFALSNAILAGRPAEALNVLSVLKFEREKPEFILGEISRTFCDMLAVRAYLDAGRSTKEIATLLKLHEYKTGLLANAVRRLDPARLARAVELCIEADTALKRSFGDYSPIEKLIAAL